MLAWARASSAARAQAAAPARSPESSSWPPVVTAAPANLSRSVAWSRSSSALTIVARGYCVRRASAIAAEPARRSSRVLQRAGQVGQRLGGPGLEVAQRIEPRRQVVEARVDGGALGQDLLEQGALSVGVDTLLRVAQGCERMPQLLPGQVEGCGERLDAVVADLGPRDCQLQLGGTDGVVGGDQRRSRCGPQVLERRGALDRLLGHLVVDGRVVGAAFRRRAPAAPACVGTDTHEHEHEQPDDPGPRAARARVLRGSEQVRRGRQRTSLGEVKDPDPRRDQACSAAMAAPAMPAWFSSCAATMSARMSIMGRNFSAFRLIPPPTTIRSGENRKSRYE